MRAAIAVADAGGVSRAAIELSISQSAVSKQILSLESFLGHPLFSRNTRHFAMTPAGEVFVEQARAAMLIQERAIQLSREVHTASKLLLRMGKSPYTDPKFISAISEIQLGQFPKLRLDIESNFSLELAKRVITGVLDLAVLTEGIPNPHLSSLELSCLPFYLLFREQEELAKRDQLKLDDLQGRIWITFGRHVHPEMYDKVNRALDRRAIEPSGVHHVTTADEAAQLVQQLGGIALLTSTGARRVLGRGLAIRPLEEGDLTLRTVLAVRADNDSAVIGDFVKAIGKKLGGRERPEQNRVILTG
jgi:DNA-binding transcriptional LysR family regulator